jgi:hypothetical protein
LVREIEVCEYVTTDLFLNDDKAEQEMLRADALAFAPARVFLCKDDSLPRSIGEPLENTSPL